MTDSGNKDIFSRNLRRYIAKSGKTRSQICTDLNLSASTLSDWATGRIYPRIDKIQLLADYFGIQKSDLMEDPKAKNSYYLDEEVSEMAQELFTNPEVRALFKASRKLSVEDMKTVKALIERLTQSQ